METKFGQISLGILLVVLLVGGYFLSDRINKSLCEVEKSPVSTSTIIKQYKPITIDMVDKVKNCEKQGGEYHMYYRFNKTKVEYCEVSKEFDL